MMRCFSLLIGLVLSVIAYSANLTVKTSVLPSQLYLGLYQGAGVVLVDTLTLDDGVAEWSRQGKIDEGVYFLSDGPSGGRFDFLVGAEQEVMIEMKSLTDPNAKVSGASESQLFQAYQSSVSNPAMTRGEKEAYTQLVFEQAEEGSFLKLVMRALLPPPAQKLSTSMLVVDDGGVYDYNISHFWDNYDLSDARLLHVPFFVPRVEYFLRQALMPREDKILPAVISLVDALEDNEPLLKLVVSSALKFSNEKTVMGIDGLTYELVQRYYLSGRFGVLPAKQQSMLEDFVLHTEYCRVGHVGRDIRIDALDRELGEVSLYEQESAYTLLVFWEPDCDYCSSILPILRDDIYKRYQSKGLSIFAVNTQRDYEAWSQFILDEQLTDWTHAYSATGVGRFMLDYGVQGTPFMYILDAEKRIVAKEVKIDFLSMMLDRLFANGSIY